MIEIKNNTSLMIKELKQFQHSDFEVLLSYKKNISNNILKIFREKLEKMEVKTKKPYFFNNCYAFGTAKISEKLKIDFLRIKKNRSSKDNLDNISFSLSIENKRILLTPKKEKIEIITINKDGFIHQLFDHGVIREIKANKEYKFIEIKTYYKSSNILTIITNTKDFINTTYYKDDKKIGYGISDLRQLSKTFYAIEYEELKLIYNNKVASGIKNKIQNQLSTSNSRINNFIRMLKDVSEKEYSYGDKISTKTIFNDNDSLKEFIMLTEIKYSI